MSAAHPFPSSYVDGRRAFVELCARAGFETEVWRHPLTGPDGEALTIDVARTGDPEARRLLFVCSGTHGVEGFCGSGVQAALIQRGIYEQLPAGVGLVLVHALNPYGFAWMRRTDDQNIDLNRNFIDHDNPYPPDGAYNEVHPMLVPADWDGPARREADQQLAEFIDVHGARALQAAVCGGQHGHPDGLFFGGRRPAWSNTAWGEILRSHAGSAEFVAVLDIHTGLGKRAACELISGAKPGGSEHALARRWFGEWVVFPGADSTAPAAHGHMSDSLAEILPRTRGALVVAEFGTVPFDRILEVLRADNWIHLHEHPGSRLWSDVKTAMYAAFVGNDVYWRDAVLEQALKSVLGAAHALAAEAATQADGEAG